MILSSRSVSPLRGLLVMVAAAVTLAGCEAGANAPTQQWHQPTPGASAVVNRAIRINNLFVLGAPPASSLTPGESAGVFVGLANDGAPDKLIGITAPGTAATVRLPAGGIALGRGQSVLLTGPVPQIVLEDLTRSLGGGQDIRLVLQFQRAGAVPLQVPVMPRASYFTSYSPPAVSPSPSPTAKAARHQATPAPSPTA